MSLDELSIIIDVVDSFSQEINSLEADLLELKGLAEAVDDINIDVNVYGEQKLSRMQAQLMALNAQLAQMRISGIGGGGGGGLSEADRAADSFDITNLRMSDLHNALARLIPLIFVYIGALPAAIGGVLALGAAAVSAAAGLAALGGLAAAGAFLQDDFTLQELIDRVKGDFEDAFGPLMDELTPMFYSMLDGLEALFDAIAARGDTLLALRDDAAAFGNFMLDWIPNVMEAMGQMAEAFGPLFGEIADILRDMNMLRGLTEFMADAAPALFSLISSLWSLIETLTTISIGFMEVAAAASRVIDIFITVITLGGLISERIGGGIAALLSLATAFYIVSAVINANFVAAISKGLTMLWTYMTAAYQTAVAEGVLTAATQVLSAAVWQLATAVAIATGGLAVIAGIGSLISSQFSGAASSIDDATNALQNFDDVNSSIGDFGAGGSTFYQFNPDSSRTIINAPDVETGKRTARSDRFSKGETDNHIITGG